MVPSNYTVNQTRCTYVVLFVAQLSGIESRVPFAGVLPPLLEYYFMLLGFNVLWSYWRATVASNVTTTTQ